MAITKVEAAKALGMESALILITENFAGHKLDWLVQISKECRKQDFTVLTIDATRISNYAMDLEIPVCSDFNSKKDLANFLKYNSVNATLIFWDADNWLFEMFFLKANIRALIMRPYLSSKSLRSIAVFLLKRSIIFTLKNRYNVNFAFLAIPFWKARNKRQKWVDDNLLIDEKILNSLRTRRSVTRNKSSFQILVPGYISARKNPELVIDACKFLSSNSQLAFRLTFQGEVEESISNMLADNDVPWLEVRKDYTLRSEYLEILNNADVVVIPYSNIGSSGVALECIALNVPVIMLRDKRWNNASANTSNILKLVKFDDVELGLLIEETLVRSSFQSMTFDFRYTQSQTAINFLVDG